MLSGLSLRRVAALDSRHHGGGNGSLAKPLAAAAAEPRPENLKNHVLVLDKDGTLLQANKGLTLEK